MTRRLRSPGTRALAGTLLGSIPGFLLPFVVAAHVGAGRSTDAFAFAFAVALFVLALVTGVIEANLLPQADGYRRAGGAALRVYVAKTLSRVAAVAAGTYATVALIAATVIATRSGFEPAERVAVVVCLTAFLPLAVTAALNSCHAVALYVAGDFLVAPASQAVRAIPPLMAIPFLGHDYRTVEVVAVLLAGGEIVRFLALRRRVRRVAERLAPVNESAPLLSYGSVARASMPHAMNMLILAANPLVDRFIAASLAAGAVTVLDLGEKTFFAPQMLITSSLILVAGTRWSNADVADPRTAAGYRSALRRTVAGATIAAIATAAALLVIANVAHSSLAAAHLGHAIPIAICLLVGLPFESVSILSARLMTSTQHTQVLPLFAVVAFVTNLIGDLIGASMCGIVGIAVATVCVRIATAALFVPHCRRLTSMPRSAPVGSLIAVARLEDANASV